jgi:FimV-like protein
MGKILPVRSAPASEQHAIAETLVERLKERIALHYPLQIEFEILSIRTGCIRVKYGMMLKLAGDQQAAAATVANYPDFKQGTKQLWDQTNDVIEFMAEGRACTARFTKARLTEQLFGPVGENVELAQIVPKLNCGANTREQVMIAIFEANRESFLDDNVNLLKTDSVLKIPAETSISEIPVQRANMQILKHMRRLKKHRE